MLFKFNKIQASGGLLVSFLISSLIIGSLPATAQERVCILADSGKKICGKLIGNSDATQSNDTSQFVGTINYSETDLNLNVKLERCIRKLNTVNCKLTVVQANESRYPYSHSIDFYGAEGANASQASDERDEIYNPKITIGNQTKNDYVSVSMIKGRRILVTLSYQMPKDVTVLKALTLTAGNHTGGSPSQINSIVFSNINISR